MSLLDTETGEIVAMDRAEAEKITAEIKAWVGTLWAKLREAHQGRAWIALGYSSWAEYVQAEFDIGKSQSYRLLAHSRAVAALADAAGLVSESPIGDIPEHHTRAIDVAAAAAEVAENVSPGTSDEERAEIVKRTITEHYESPEDKKRRERKSVLDAIASDPEATNEQIAERVGCPLIRVVSVRNEISAGDAQSRPSRSTPPAAPAPSADEDDEPPAASAEDRAGAQDAPADPVFDPAAYRDRAITEELKARKGLLSLSPDLLAQTDRCPEWVDLARDLISWGQAVEAACSDKPNLRSVPCA